MGEDNKDKKAVNPVYISKERNIFTGEKASEFLREKNDLLFLKSEIGVTQVSPERWQEAQKYERKIWLEDKPNVKEDRNTTHKEHFNGYEVLGCLQFKRVIELGCGPFTNLRYIARVADIDKCHLLDPLIEDYLSHPNCRYKDQKLTVERDGLMGKFGLHRKIPATLHKSTIEEFDPSLEFDLVVMINVIEHCFDANAVQQKILQITDEDAILVFHDKYYLVEELEDRLTNWYDAGHPIKIDKRVIKEYLDLNFIPLYEKNIHVKYERWGEDRSYEALYYIGKKR